jgi:hypothetical protein
MGGDSGDVRPAAVPDQYQDVKPAQEDDVDVGEVDRDDRVGMRDEELSLGRSGRRGPGSNRRP